MEIKPIQVYHGAVVDSIVVVAVVLLYQNLGFESWLSRNCLTWIFKRSALRKGVTWDREWHQIEPPKIRFVKWPQDQIYGRSNPLSHVAKAERHGSDSLIGFWLHDGHSSRKTRQRSSNQLLENHQLTFELAAIFFLIKMLVIGRTTFSWNPRFVLLIGSFQVRSLCREQVCRKNKFGGTTKLERFQFIKDTRAKVNREKSSIWEANRKNNLA